MMHATLSESMLSIVQTAIDRFDSDLRAIRALASPFEPAMELWQMGVGIQAVMPRTIVLVLPVVRA